MWLCRAVHTCVRACVSFYAAPPLSPCVCALVYVFNWCLIITRDGTSHVGVGVDVGVGVSKTKLRDDGAVQQQAHATMLGDAAFGGEGSMAEVAGDGELQVARGEEGLVLVLVVGVRERPSADGTGLGCGRHCSSGLSYCCCGLRRCCCGCTSDDRRRRRRRWQLRQCGGQGDVLRESMLQERLLVGERAVAVETPPHRHRRRGRRQQRGAGRGVSGACRR